MIFNKKNIIKTILIIWVILWINFILRDLFKRQYFYEYKILIKRDWEGKRSYVYGDDFYSFLKFCKGILPEQSTYRFVGVEDLSLTYRRAVYYLYPLIESKNPDFLLVYNITGYQKDGYRFFEKLDREKFILKKE